MAAVRWNQATAVFPGDYRRRHAAGAHRRPPWWPVAALVIGGYCSGLALFTLLLLVVAVLW